MEYGITVKQAETSMQQEELSPFLQKQNEILALLTRCSIRRGVPQNSASLAIYVQDLSSYSLDVIAPVLEKFGGEAPDDYKPLWPAVGVFLDLMRGHIRGSRPSVEQESAARWLNYIARCKAEGTEEPDADTLKQIEALNEKFGLKKPKEVVTVNSDLVCPRCQFAQSVPANFRNWTAAEILEYGAVVQGLELIADRNRSMPRLPLGDVVDEVTA